MSNTGTIVAIVTDLLFQSRLEAQARALGFEVTVVDAPEAIRPALATTAALAVLDLHAAGIDWREAVALAQELAVPVLAFGRHANAEALRAAREAGCTRVVARSTLVAELERREAFLQQLLDDGVSAIPAVEEAVAAFTSN